MTSSSPLAPPADARRIEGLWLRKLAALGSVYAPEWFKRRSPPLIAAATFALVAERSSSARPGQKRLFTIG